MRISDWSSDVCSSDLPLIRSACSSVFRRPSHKPTLRMPPTSKMDHHKSGNHKEADMSDQQGADIKMPDPVELSQTMARIAEQSQRIVSDFLGRQGGDGVGMSDPLNVGREIGRASCRERVCQYG